MSQQAVRQSNGKHTEQQNEKRIKRSEDTLRVIYGNIKWNNIHIIGDLMGGKKEKACKII